MSNSEIEKISKALGDPYRLQIIEAVKNQTGQMQCAAIVDMLDLAQPTISHHIRQLVDAGLLLAQKEGRTTCYEINHVVMDDYIRFFDTYKK